MGILFYTALSFMLFLHPGLGKETLEKETLFMVV